MEIHFQTTDHVVAMEKVAEQHIARKYSKCNSLRVISHIITLGKSVEKFIRTTNLPKMCNCSNFRENCVTHALTHTHGANYNLRAGREIKIGYLQYF